MALTRKGKFLALVLVIGITVGVFYFAASKGLIGKKASDAQVDTGTPAAAPEPVQQAQDAPQAPSPQPQVEQPQQPAPVVSSAPSDDPSQNRGMKFLLKQGKE